MAKQLPKYESFRAFAEDGDHYFKDIANSDDQHDFTFVVDIYRGILEGQSVEDTVDDGFRYIYLGKTYNDLFMRLDHFDERLQGKTLVADYAKVKENNYKLFPVWNSRGKPIPSLPSAFTATYRNGLTREQWSNKQCEQWSKVIQATGDAKRVQRYNVLSRFIQPDAFPGFELVFSTAEGEEYVTVPQLKDHVAEATKNSDASPYQTRVVDWNAASKDPSLVLLSTSFYFFYHTWISSANYKELCTRTNTNPPERPWPKNAAAAAAIDGLLKTDPVAGDGLRTETLVSSAKTRAARGMRAVVTSQPTVMGGSATPVAQALWDKKTLTPGKKPADAEWLHRSAFHFAGLGNHANLLSSQSRLNLVFGTGECNTDMIRGENAVTELTNLLRDSHGTLTTENIVRGAVERRQPDGKFVSQQIPDWVAQNRNKGKGELLWLSPNLKFRFTMSDKDLNLSLNALTTYDPFSRYVPFLLEARLDEIILRGVVKERMAALAQPKPVVPLVSTFAISPSLKHYSPASGFATNFIDSAVPHPITVMSAHTSRLSATPSLHGAVPRAAVNSNSLSTVDAPPLSPPVLHQWSRVASGADSITANGVVVRSPALVPHQGTEPVRLSASSRRPMTFALFTSQVANGALSPLPALATSPPPDGFTLEGEIDLFGQPTLHARFYSWNGPVPPHVIVRVDKPIYDKATLDGDFKLPSLLPVLESTPFNDLTFRNVTFTYQNCVFDATKALGWHVEADFVVDDSYGPLHDLLRTVLNVQEPTVHLHAGLGMNQEWSRALTVSSFTLDGTFAGISAKICDGLTLTSIGVKLLGVRRMEYAPAPRSVMDFGFGAFGTLSLGLPGSALPLQLSYEIVEMGGLLQLVADLDGEIWKEPFGISGLQLSNVMFSADVKASTPMQSFQFEVVSTFQYKSTAAIFTGSYSAGGDFVLSATVTAFSLSNINDLFESLTSSSLDFPDLDVKIGSASITVASGSGLTIALQNVQVGEHVAANALLSISSSGAVIRGDISSSDTVVLGEVELKKAYIEITLPAKLEGAGVVLGGEVAFESFTLNALVHLYQAQDGSGLEWTAIASLTTTGSTLALSRLAPELKGTFLDLTLSNAVFVAASKEDPAVTGYIATPYPIRRGVQICATLSPIQSLDSLMRSSTPTSGLVLSAGWSKETGYALDVLMPSESVINLGNGIVTDPFTLRIQGGLSPTLLVIAGVKIPVEPQGSKLNFQLSLGVNVLGASAAAQMHGWWVNPLGLGQNVKIGPDVALAIEIIFAQFLATGTPSGFGVVAGLAIGKTTASVAMQVSENPKNEVLSGEVQKLDVNDVVSFANVITGLDIPQPPKFLDFEQVKLYICPGGTTIGTIVYPQGFSFQGAMVMFGKRAEIACAVGSTSVVIKGGVDNFTLGPLAVRGINEPRATVDISLDPSRQHILVDGVVTFYDASCVVSVNVNVLPNPSFFFYTSLKFTELLNFTLEAKLVGALTFDEINDSDFEFYASLEQHILEYVRDQINLQFDAARAAADDGFKIAEDKLSEAQKTVDQGIADAQSDLDSAQVAWDAKRKEITDNSNQVMNDYLSEVSQLQGNIDQAQRDYDNAMAVAQAALQNANNDRASKMREAQNGLQESKHRAQEAIDNASRDLQNAQDKMKREFGNAQSNIDSAKATVDSLQHDIDDTTNEINRVNNLRWYDPGRAQLVPLGAKLAGLWAPKQIADTALNAAKAVLTGAGYLADQSAINIAQGALQAAQIASPSLISAAQSVLDGVDQTTSAAVQGAQATVDATRTGVQYGVLQGAKSALSTYVSANKAAYDAAQHALDTITTVTEYIAFQAAKGALDTAKAATFSLEGLKEALVVARQAEDFALEIAQWIAQHAVGLVDIRKIELSGSLRGLVTPDGAVGKPLKAHVEYLLAGQSGTFEGELDLRQTAAFITSIFKQMWEEVKSIV